MIRWRKALVSFLIVCLLTAACGMTVFARSSNLPDSFCIDDENGISVANDGEYFMYADDLMPGDVITRTLTLRNLEQGDPFKMHMTGEPIESTGPVDWLDNLHLLITLDGREIYAGRLRGDGKDTHTMKGNGADMLDKGLDLGEYKKGDYGVLKFVVTADVGYLSAEDFVEVSQARIRWIFSAAKDEAAAPPDTGEIAKNGLYILLILLLLLCVVFYYRYRRLRGNC